MIDPQSMGPKADTWIGGIMAALGSLGITIQVTQWTGGLILFLLNVSLAIGGLNLIRLRAKAAKLDLDAAIRRNQENEHG